MYFEQKCFCLQKTSRLKKCTACSLFMQNLKLKALENRDLNVANFKMLLIHQIIKLNSSISSKTQFTLKLQNNVFEVINLNSKLNHKASTVNID
jgi:hypothetical protein